jgi:hypothetical protein
VTDYKTTRQSVTFQRLRRKLRKKAYTAKLGDENGVVVDTDFPGQGILRARLVAGADADGFATYSPYFNVRYRPGTAVYMDAGREVEIEEARDGHLYVVGNTWDDLRAANLDPLQTNPVSRRHNWVLLEWIINLVSKAISTADVGSMSVTIYPALYERHDGLFGIFSGTGDGTTAVKVDLTVYVPASVDDQVLVVVWVSSYNNAVTVTASSEISQNTNLRTRNNLGTLLTLINECAASRPPDAFGTRAYVVRGDDTYIDMTNEMNDLRPFFRSPERYGFPNPVTRSVRIWPGYRVVVAGDVVISEGVEIIIEDGGEMVVI